MRAVYGSYRSHWHRHAQVDSKIRRVLCKMLALRSFLSCRPVMTLNILFLILCFLSYILQPKPNQTIPFSPIFDIKFLKDLFCQYKKITSIFLNNICMDQTGNSFGSNPASLKGKLQTLEQQIKNISNELNNHKKEVQILRSEKDTLESVLTMKTADVKKSLSNQLVRIEEEMKRHFNFQKAENSRIQQQITSLKGEKTALQQQLLGLQRRITELEMQVGSEGR